MCEQDSYFALMQELKMDGFVRQMGYPRQFSVSSPHSFFLNFEMLNNKSTPVYMSSNRHNGHLILEKFFLEFEGTDNSMKQIERAHTDFLKTIEWAEKNNATTVALQSGNKSFHVFIHLKDSNANDSSERTYNNIGRGLVSKLGLKTLDIHCCEPKRLHRVPLSMRQGQRTCTPIPVSMYSDLRGIIELTKAPVVKLGRYKTKGKEIELKDLTSLAGGPNTSAFPATENTPVHQSFFVPQTADDFLKYLDMIVQQKCVLSDLLVPHPEHDTRIAFIAWLNFLKFTSEEAVKLTDKLSEYSQWDDRENTDTRHYYVRHAIGRRYVPYSCKKLQEKGLKCVGSGCPMWGGAGNGLRKDVESTQIDST